jgi:hypothetical protein
MSTDEVSCQGRAAEVVAFLKYRNTSTQSANLVASTHNLDLYRNFIPGGKPTGERRYANGGPRGSGLSRIEGTRSFSVIKLYLIVPAIFSG